MDTTSPAIGGFHQTWTQQFDGQVYAEPLAVGNRVYVATENDTVYALNAGNGRIAWKRHLGTPVDASTLPCGNISPVTGITGTPAISGPTLYVTAFLSGYRHVLFGLHLRGGKVVLKRNVDAPGADPRVHQERSALSVSKGRVYVPFGGLTGDCGDYRGRVVSVRTHGKPRKLTFTAGVNREGGIWAPSGAAVEGRGNLFVVTGNGDNTSGFDFGNSVIRLSRKLKQTDFYRASNSPQLNQSDTDLGSVGPTLLGANRMFVIGKEGLGLVLDHPPRGDRRPALRAERLRWRSVRRARVPGPVRLCPVHRWPARPPHQREYVRPRLARGLLGRPTDRLGWGRLDDR